MEKTVLSVTKRDSLVNIRQSAHVGGGIIKRDQTTEIFKKKKTHVYYYYNFLKIIIDSRSKNFNHFSSLTWFLQKPGELD